MSETLFLELIRQNEIIISLLGRLAYDEKTIKEIIIKNKKEELRSKYLEGYNACDGKKNQTEIAAIIGVNQATFQPIITDWVNIGIVYEIHKGNKTFYKNIFSIKI